MRNKIGILLENRFIDKEIIYYGNRFKEEGLEVVFLSRLWGQAHLEFKGMELGLEMSVDQSFEDLTAEDLSTYSAIIVPAGYVADYLLYSKEPKVHSPAVNFIEKVMADKAIHKGFICHSLWLSGPLKEVFTGRVVTCHNNIISHVENTGMVYVDETVHVDEDLVTARTGGHFAEFSAELIRQIKRD